MLLPLRKRFLLFLCLSLPFGPAHGESQQDALDQAFAQYWQADEIDLLAAASARILSSRAGFDGIWARLVVGRPYFGEVDTGRLDLSNRSSDGTLHHYRVLVPDNYDPARRYPVRFYLHGGVQRPAWRKGGRWWRQYDLFKSEDRISVFPSSWNESQWWTQRQAENLSGILAQLKRRYNVDENRVYLIGVSDGATGAWFHALRQPTAWAAYLPFIGHAGVLNNPWLKVDGQIHAGNAFGRPFFVVSAGLDRLYPTEYVLPYLELMQRAGANMTFRHKPKAGHDLSWWGSEGERIRDFIQARQRDPLPEKLVWETETVERYNRNAWLLIDELGAGRSDPALDQFNTLLPLPALGFEPERKSKAGVGVSRVSPDSVAAAAGLLRGDRVIAINQTPTANLDQLNAALGQTSWGDSVVANVDRDGQRLELTMQVPDHPPPGESAPAFRRSSPSGRVELSRVGNRIVVSSQGVRRYTLLLSPTEIDFDQPLTVITNGVESWRGLVQRNAATLLKWAARDQDRSMLFGAELEIEL